MKIFVKCIKNERGVSLVELLAALTLFSLIAGIIYATISFGFDSYHKVNIENSLRDEGDLVTTAIINNMYIFAPDKIVSIPFKNGILLVRNSELNQLELKLQEDSTGKGRFYVGTTQESQDNATLPIYELTSSILLNDEGRDNLVCVGVNSGTCMEGSKITLECSDVTECVTGVIKIRLVLMQEYKHIPQTLVLESKFGF